MLRCPSLHTWPPHVHLHPWPLPLQPFRTCMVQRPAAPLGTETATASRETFCVHWSALWGTAEPPDPPTLQPFSSIQTTNALSKICSYNNIKIPIVVPISFFFFNIYIMGVPCPTPACCCWSPAQWPATGEQEADYMRITNVFIMFDF